MIVPRVPTPEGALAAALQRIRRDLQLPESFPAAVEREAGAVHPEPAPVDLTEVPFVTIDPAGATDLDQALHLERSGDGMLVRYAIADVPAFVAPGGAIDAEARERGQTLYAPDGRIPLHPPVISENAASLLPGVERGAYVWTFELDARGEPIATTLERARIRSRRQYSYPEAQDAVADEPMLGLLREFGELRQQRERERGGASLDRPDEEVVRSGDRYELVRRSPLPIEWWNAQVSLLTGMAAARIMLDGGVGILRTMPPPPPEALDRFRLQVAALGVPWPDGQPYGEYLRGLDRSSAAGLAAIHAAASLFRGAGYTAFDGEPPENPVQAAVAAPYAHATAPLRRLVDRFVLVACHALVNGMPVPQWVREALPTLPKLMARSDGVASRLEHASVDAIEAALLTGRECQAFDAVVISVRDGGGVIQLVDPPVTAAIEGRVRAGDSVRAELVAADIASGTTLFRA